MKPLIYGFTALGLVLSLGLASAPDALAKAHDSGVSDRDSPPKGGRDFDNPPGQSTSEAAQGLGGPNMGEVTSDAAQNGEDPGFSGGKGDVSGGASDGRGGGDSGGDRP